MLFKNITILNENFEIEENVNVLIKDDKIVSISKELPKVDFGEVYDGKGKLLMSGFFNTHAHSPMTLLRGYGENASLQDWLNKMIFPFEAKLYSDAVYWATKLAMAESLRFGIVSSTDMYYFIDDMVRAISESKCKNNVSFATTHFDDTNPKNIFGYIETERLIKEYHKTFNNKILIDASLHAEYTSKEGTVKAISELAKNYGVNMHVHISETEVEHNECIMRHKMTPVRYFAENGAFDTKATAAHCVWVDEEDMDILSNKGVTVASNPISNLKLASGVCNVPKLLSKGVNVAIGTDSVASNNSLNFFEEMKTFALVSKMMFKDPTVVTPKQALYSATRAGAIAQGRMDSGLVKEGFKADLIVINIDVPNMKPVHNLVNNLVFSASGSDVLLTMVDGEILYKNGEYYSIDIEKTSQEVENARKEILSKL